MKKDTLASLINIYQLVDVHFEDRYEQDIIRFGDDRYKVLIPTLEQPLLDEKELSLLKQFEVPLNTIIPKHSEAWDSFGTVNAAMLLFERDRFFVNINFGMVLKNFIVDALGEVIDNFERVVNLETRAQNLYIRSSDRLEYRMDDEVKVKKYFSSKIDGFGLLWDFGYSPAEIRGNFRKFGEKQMMGMFYFDELIQMRKEALRDYNFDNFRLVE